MSGRDERNVSTEPGELNDAALDGVTGGAGLFGPGMTKFGLLQQHMLEAAQASAGAAPSASSAPKKGEADHAQAAVLTALDDQIDQALNRLKGAGDRFNQTLDNVTDAVKDRGNTLGRAKFGA